jgi:hypothetical protein
MDNSFLCPAFQPLFHTHVRPKSAYRSPFALKNLVRRFGVFDEKKTIFGVGRRGLTILLALTEAYRHARFGQSGVSNKGK